MGMFKRNLFVSCLPSRDPLALFVIFLGDLHVTCVEKWCCDVM